MEYDFYYNEYQQAEATFSEDFLAFGLWMSAELTQSALSQTLFDDILQTANALLQGAKTPKIFKGQNFTLTLSADSACVLANNLPSNSSFNSSSFNSSSFNSSSFNSNSFNNNVDNPSASAYGQAGFVGDDSHQNMLQNTSDDEAYFLDDTEYSTNNTSNIDSSNNNADFYDAELSADCGLDDFKEALLAWRDFLSD